MRYRPRQLLVAVTAFVIFAWSASPAGDNSLPVIKGTVTFFYYDDLESAARFYEDLLQLPKTMNEDWVKIYQASPSSSVGLVQNGRGFHEVTADKPAMFSMVTDDVDAWYAHLKTADVTMLKELPPPDKEKKPGTAPVRGFVAEDPGGYTIEFFSWQESTGGQATAHSLREQVDGLWYYTDLISSDGTEMPLTGVFLFKDGVFLQQAVFDDGIFDEAGSMAHVGPFIPEPATGSIHLVAEQTISISPTDSPALSFRQGTKHDVTVNRSNSDLTLIFSMGTGTVQEFTYVGPGEGELFALADGALAFVDGHFILIDGDAASVTTAYGTYEKRGENLSLKVIRWAEADDAGSINRKDITIEATFDGQSLVFEDGRSFQVL